MMLLLYWILASLILFFSSRRRHTRLQGDWSSDVCSSDLPGSSRRARELRRRHGERGAPRAQRGHLQDRKSTRLNSSHLVISYAVFCLKKKKKRTSSRAQASGGSATKSSTGRCTPTRRRAR